MVIDDIIKSLKALTEKASPTPWVSKSGTSNGWSMFAPFPSVCHVEFTTKTGYRPTAELVPMIAYEPWVQFSPKEYNDLISANFQLMAESRNAIPYLISRIEELEAENLELKKSK